MFSKLGPVCFALFAVSALAQAPAAPSDAIHVERALNAGLPPNQLKCELDTLKPFLDFAFRFEVGFIVRCALRQFDGQQARLAAFIRVRPAGAAPVVFSEGFLIPAIPPSILAEVKLKKLHNQIEFSGVFGLGEGDYPIDLLVVDNRGRVFHKAWETEAVPHGNEKNAPVAIQPNSAVSVAVPLWTGNSPANVAGPRLTVLLDAAPIFPRSLKLRAWDRAFLLGSLSSLLREIPSSSIRLVAFNLDQQRIVFREDNFGPSGFGELSQALRNLELGTVSYGTLSREQGWATVLAGLVNEEAAGGNPADAVIFLGPHNRIPQKVPREMLKLEGSHPPFFYFEYFPYWGSDFPDAIHELTNECSGTVLKLHSPGELAEAIQKMQKKLKQTNARDASGS